MGNDRATEEQVQVIVRMAREGRFSFEQARAIIDRTFVVLPRERTSIPSGPVQFGSSRSSMPPQSRFKLRSVEEQARLAHELCPELDFSAVDRIAAELSLVLEQLEKTGVILDGLALIPKMTAIMRMLRNFPEILVYESPLNQCMDLLFAFLENARSDFRRPEPYRRDGLIGPDVLKFYKPTRQVMLRFEERTPGDLLVVPVQTGWMYAERDPQKARDSFSNGEFGLDPFSVGFMILTHPELLCDDDQLDIDCPGGDCGGRVPLWYFYNRRLTFKRTYLEGEEDESGSATGFVLKGM